jgi:putative ABC transport system permease protein
MFWARSKLDVNMATQPQTGRHLAERFFNAFLRLFPAEFREHFAGEMRTVFRDQEGDARATGGITYLRFCWETSRGLVVAAFREHREILFQDVDYALRLMRKDLSFTAVVIAILGMAIGASTAAFMAANAVLLEPLPFTGGNHLIHLQQRRPAIGVDNMLFSVKEIEDYRSQNHTLDSVVEFHEMVFSLLGGNEPERVDTGVVSANFFRVLGVSPLHGRTFMDEDDQPNAHPVLVLSYRFWQKAFAGDPNVVGRKYSMNDKEHVVVGILPPIPQFPAEVDVYMPTVACPTRSGEHAIHERSWHMMNVFATLKPGVTMAEAQGDLSRIAEGLQKTYPEEYPQAKGYEISLQPVHEELSRGIRPVLIVLAAATGLLLLLACANVTGIMVSRVLARIRELTVRSILGASRNRIIRSLITEGILLAMFGGLVGWVLAYSSLGLLVSFTSRYTSLASQLEFTPQIGAFCFLLSVGCGVAIGLLPALGVRYTPLFTMEAGNASLPPGRLNSKGRGVLIATQLALSVILLVGAGLALRTVMQLQRVDAGFRPSGLLTARIYILNDRYREFFTQLLERTQKLPGVESAGLASTIPLHAVNMDGPQPIEVRDSEAPSDGKPNNPIIRIVTPGYFSTLGANIVQGRDFSDRDTDATPAVIVNEHMATHYWPRGDAIGKQISVSPGQWIPIVGVVSDIRHAALDKEPVDEAYGSFWESRQGTMSLVVRSSQPSPELSQQIAWIAHDIDPNAVVADVQPMTQLRSDWLEPRRTTAIFLSVFAVVALCITASGISGMMAVAVGERKHEIGVRLALGATPSTVIRSMMKQVLTVTTIGLAAGFVAAWAMSRFMASVISGVTPRDGITFAASAALLLAVAMASGFVPLKQIARLDPVVLLKTE